MCASRTASWCRAFSTSSTKKREEEKKAEVLGIIKEATGKVVVQFDKNIPYDIVTKIMATCGYAGYNNIKFAVTKKGEE